MVRSQRCEAPSLGAMNPLSLSLSHSLTLCLAPRVLTPALLPAHQRQDCSSARRPPRRVVCRPPFENGFAAYAPAPSAPESARPSIDTLPSSAAIITQDPEKSERSCH